MSSKRDYLKGKKCMIWSFMGNSRMFQALNNHGDCFDTVGIFTFEVDITGTISETEDFHQRYGALHQQMAAYQLGADYHESRNGFYFHSTSQ